MASETLPSQYLKAGQEYVDALVKLGLYPEFASWGQQIQTKQWMLVLVTPAIEIGGPLAMNELLFRAYNMGATPKEISPFIIRVFGRRTIMAQEFINLNGMRPGMVRVQKIDQLTKRPVGEPTLIESIGQDYGDLHIETRDVYELGARKRGHEQRTREWLRFKQNVEKLAA